MARISWTKELVTAEAAKHVSMREFILSASGAYAYAKRHDIIKEVCGHMVALKKTWTIEELIKEASKYTSRGDFSVLSGGAYQYAVKHKVLDEVCGHMSQKYSRITAEMVKVASESFTSITSFRRVHERLYEFAQRKGLLKELLGHLTGGHSTWTLEQLQEEALKYTSRTEFLSSNEAAYTAAIKMNALESICSEMVRRTRTFTDYDIPSQSTGLYALYNDDELVYIGKSNKCIHNRVVSHSKGKQFNKVVIADIVSAADIDVLEIYYINKYKPKYNLDSNSGATLNITINNNSESYAIQTTTTYTKKDTHE